MAIKLETSFDYTNLNRIMKDISRLQTTEVSISFDESSHSDEDTLTNAELALIHELGVRNPKGGWKIPPRRFVSRAGYILAESIDKEASNIVINTIKGKVSLVNRDLEKIGMEGVESIQESIDRQGFTKLSPTTIRLKRNKNSRFPTTQLVDTSALRDSANYTIK